MCYSLCRIINNRLSFIVSVLIVIESFAYAYAEAPVPASYYVGTLYSKISKHWHPPADYAGQMVVVSFKVRPDGSIFDLNCKTRNDPKYAYWNAGMTAVRESLPFPRPSASLFQGGQHFTGVSIDLRGLYRSKGSKKSSALPSSDSLKR